MKKPARNQTSVLVVDDEVSVCGAVKMALEDRYRVESVGTAEEARDLMNKEAIDIVLCDIRLPGMDGLSLMEILLEDDPMTTVIVITGYASAETAVRALKRGAYDYLVKPFDPEEILQVVNRAAETRRLQVQNEAWRKVASSATGEQGTYIGDSAAMKRLYQAAAQVAATDAPVFITGESGSGKEVLARYIHRNSTRSGQPLIAVNCAAFSESLMDSEVFGHVKGAFTGAVSDRRGYLELASQGTLLLDEIAEFKLELQARLLRVVENQTLTRLGSERPISVDVRFIAAAQKSPQELVQEGRLREDLYFRLGVVTLEVPPLRERASDIPGMVSHLLGTMRRELKKDLAGVDFEALECLTQYSWPGNVRELRNVLERAAIFARPGEPISVRDLPEAIRKSKSLDPFSLNAATLPTLDEVQQRYMDHVLSVCDGNRTKAAEILGVSPSTLWRRSKDC